MLLNLKVAAASASKTTLQNKVFEDMRELILGGELLPGMRLPATRHLSKQLGVGRNTIASAYAQLESEGYIESRQSVGTFVAKSIPEKSFNVMNSQTAADFTPFPFHSPMAPQAKNFRTPFDFCISRRDTHFFPCGIWAKLLLNQLRGGPPKIARDEECGHWALRQTISDMLRPSRGIRAGADQILIVAHRLAGLSLAFNTLFSPRTIVVVESPCFEPAASLFQHCNAQLYPIAVDQKGIITANLPNVRGAIVYVTPSHQQPLGVTLSLERRVELLEWASRTKSFIIEDDIESEFRFEGSPLRSLASMDRDQRVIYAGGFSHSMDAGIAVGFLVVPPLLREKASNQKGLIVDGDSWLEQATLNEFIRLGHYEKHLRRLRRRYVNQRNSLLNSLREHFGTLHILGMEGGTHLAWRIPERFENAFEVQALARKKGVNVCPLSCARTIDFGIMPDVNRYLALSFRTLSEFEISNGIACLASALGIANTRAHAPDWRQKLS